MAETVEQDFDSIVATLKAARRDAAYLLSVLEAAEVGLDDLLGLEAPDRAKFADIAFWAYRACGAAEAAGEVLLAQASSYRLLEECVGRSDSNGIGH